MTERRYRVAATVTTDFGHSSRSASQTKNFLGLLAGLTLEERWTFLASFCSWTVVAYDFWLFLIIAPQIKPSPFSVNDRLYTSIVHLAPYQILVSYQAQAANALPVALVVLLILIGRPFGALIFGQFADHYNRRQVLKVAITCSTIIELLIAISPNIFGFGLFLVLQLVFGMCMGGVWGVGMSLALDALLPSDVRRGQISGILQSGYPCGLMLAGLASISLLFYQHSLDWLGLFIAGTLPGLVLSFILVFAWRPKQPTLFTPEDHGPLASNVQPLWRAVREKLGSKNQQESLWLLVGLMIVFGFMAHSSQDIYPSFLRNLIGFDRAPKILAIGANADPKVSIIGIFAVIYGIAGIVGGYSFGKHANNPDDRPRLMMVAAVVGLLLIPLWAGLFPPIQATQPNFILLAVGTVLIQFQVQGAFGVIPVYLYDHMPAQWRSTSMGIIYNAGIFFAGFTLIIVALVSWLGDAAHISWLGDLKQPPYAQDQAVFVAVIFIALIVLARRAYKTSRVSDPKSHKHDQDHNRRPIDGSVKFADLNRWVLGVFLVILLLVIVVNVQLGTLPIIVGSIPIMLFSLVILFLVWLVDHIRRWTDKQERSNVDQSLFLIFFLIALAAGTTVLTEYIKANDKSFVNLQWLVLGIVPASALVLMLIDTLKEVINHSLTERRIEQRATQSVSNGQVIPSDRTRLIQVLQAHYEHWLKDKLGNDWRQQCAEYERIRHLKSDKNQGYNGTSILGWPGSGRSVYLRCMALDELNKLKDQSDEPLPVILSLEHWHKERKRTRSLSEWLVERMEHEFGDSYPLTRNAARLWIQQKEVAFYFDDLDRLPEKGRADCVNAINDYLNEERPVKLYVASWPAEIYWNQPCSPRLQETRLLQPLTIQQVAAYIRNEDSHAQGLLDSLPDHAPSGKVTDQVYYITPRMLKLFEVDARESLEAVVSVSSADKARHLEKLTHVYVQCVLHPDRAPTDRIPVDQRNKHTTSLAQQVWSYFRRFDPNYVPEQRLHWLAFRLQSYEKSSRKDTTGHPVFRGDKLSPDWPPLTHIIEQHLVRSMFWFGGIALLSTLIGAYLNASIGLLIVGPIYGLIAGCAAAWSVRMKVAPARAMDWSVGFGFLFGLLLGPIYGLFLLVAYLIFPYARKVAKGWLVRLLQGWWLVASMFGLLTIALAVRMRLDLLKLVAPDLQLSSSLLFFSNPVINHLLAGLVVALSIGLLLRQQRKDEAKAGNNEAKLDKDGEKQRKDQVQRSYQRQIQQSFINNLVAVLFMLQFLVVFSTLISTNGKGYPVTGPAVAVLIAILVGVTLPWFGGLYVMQHLLVRGWLLLKGVMPFNYERFLKEGVSRGLLRWDDNEQGYCFLQPYFQDYFLRHKTDTH